MEITIDGVSHYLDVEAAKCAGLISKMPNYPLKSGDVYVAKGCAPFLLIQPFYKQDNAYLLIGNRGLEAFSNSSLQKVLTRASVFDELCKEGYTYSHNVSEAVSRAVSRAINQ